MRKAAAFIAALLIVAAGFAGPAAAGFRHGVNLSHWLQYDGRQPVSAADLNMIAAAGFDHVRLPFDPVLLGWDPLNPDPDAPLPQVNRIEAGVDMALNAGLSVIVDFHPTNATQEIIEGKPAVREAYLALWSWLAKRLATRPADRVAFELMNEPQYYARGATPWNVLQGKAAEVVRRAAPHNLLLLSGIHGSDVDALERTATVVDRNVCYVFHFYDPQLVTHMGADWDPYPDRAQGMMRGLVYPASDMTPAKVELKPAARVNVVSEAVRRYLNEGWNYDRIVDRIGIAREWAVMHQTCVQATEFGILRGTLETDSRLRWMGDVRRAMEYANIGWTIWDYADLFGVANTTGAVEHVNPATTAVLRDARTDPSRYARAFDPLALAALGLTKGVAQAPSP